MSLYYRCFGFPGGAAVHGQPNRDFKNLWMRFLSAVSSLVRQYSVDTLIRATIPAAVHQEQVRQSGRDLAANLSLHGFGIAYFAATELQQEITDIIELFSEPEVKAAYASRDMYQVVEQIMLFAGGQVESSVQKRVTANAGAVIIRWLANNASRLSTSNLQGCWIFRASFPVRLTVLEPTSPPHPASPPTRTSSTPSSSGWPSTAFGSVHRADAQAMEPPRRRRETDPGSCHRAGRARHRGHFRRLLVGYRNGPATASPAATTRPTRGREEEGTACTSHVRRRGQRLGEAAPGTWGPP